MEQTKEVVKLISHGNDVYTLMAFPDEDRWLWFVTLTSTALADSAHWGRFLGCGDALSEKEALNRAKGLVEYDKKN